MFFYYIILVEFISFCFVSAIKEFMAETIFFGGRPSGQLSVVR